MGAYPFDSITVNGKNVFIQDVLNGKASGYDDFERDLFTFISEWLGASDDFVLHTSGSTGKPKAIIITRKQMIASARLTAEALTLKPGYHALICLSTAYIAGKMMVVRCFVTGMRIIAVTPSSNPLLHLSNYIDFAAMVPLQVHHIIRSQHARLLNKVRCIIIGGGALDRDTESLLQDVDTTFYATYGMTETISHVALRRLNGSAKSSDFHTLPGITIQKDDRECLVIDWAELPGQTVTNDIVEITGPSSFRWLGRWDHVINTGGLKVMPEVVESAITGVFRKLGINQEFFVIGVPDKKLGSKVLLVMEGKTDRDLTSLLERSLIEVLKKHEVPKEIVSIDQFVRTETGKINRRSTLNLT